MLVLFVNTHPAISGPQNMSWPSEKRCEHLIGCYDRTVYELSRYRATTQAQASTNPRANGSTNPMVAFIYVTRVEAGDFIASTSKKIMRETSELTSSEKGTLGRIDGIVKVVEVEYTKDGKKRILVDRGGWITMENPVDAAYQLFFDQPPKDDGPVFSVDSEKLENCMYVWNNRVRAVHFKSTLHEKDAYASNIFSGIIDGSIGRDNSRMTFLLDQMGIPHPYANMFWSAVRHEPDQVSQLYGLYRATKTGEAGEGTLEPKIANIFEIVRKLLQFVKSIIAVLFLVLGIVTGPLIYTALEIIILCLLIGVTGFLAAITIEFAASAPILGVVSILLTAVAWIRGIDEMRDVFDHANSTLGRMTDALDENLQTLKGMLPDLAATSKGSLITLQNKIETQYAEVHALAAAHPVQGPLAVIRENGEELLVQLRMTVRRVSEEDHGP